MNYITSNENWIMFRIEEGQEVEVLTTPRVPIEM